MNTISKLVFAATAAAALGTAHAAVGPVESGGIGQVDVLASQSQAASSSVGPVEQYEIGEVGVSPSPAQSGEVVLGHTDRGGIGQVDFGS